MLQRIATTQSRKHWSESLEDKQKREQTEALPQAVECQTETLEENKRNERKNVAQTAMNDGTNAVINAMV